MLITRFDHTRDTQPKPQDVSFLTFASLLAEFDFRQTKDGPLWCPAEFTPGESRSKRNVERIHLLGMDLDKITPEELDEVRQALDGFEYVVHSTWSHPKQIQAGRGCYRLFVQLDRPVLASEWSTFWAAANVLLGCGKLDPATKDPSRIFYTPSAPEGTEEHAYYHHALGEPLSVDMVLEAAEELDFSQTNHRPKKVRPWAEVEGFKPNPADIEEAEAWLEERARELENHPLDEPIHLILNATAYWAGARCPHLLKPERVRERLLQALQIRRPDMATAFDPKSDQTYRDKYIHKIQVGLHEAREKGEPYLPTDKMVALNEDALALRVVKSNPDRLLYVAQWGRWLTWLGTHWEIDNKNTNTERAAQQTVNELRHGLDFIEDAKYVKGAKVFYKSYLKTNARRSLVSTMRILEDVEAFHTEFDQDPDALNTLGGLVNLRTKEVTEHTPDQRVTKLVDIHYNPHARCPTWERFVLECMGGDLTLVNYLQRAAGYSLTGHVQEHCLFFLHGDGRNGKTTFVNTLSDVLGGVHTPHGYARNGAPDLLLAKYHQVHPNETVPLYGARLCSVTEVNDNRAWAESKVKELTGGEAITTRRMREEFWTFLPTHKFWVSGNHRPKVRGTDTGIWSRIKLIPFTESFEGREDRDLPRKLHAEREGILKWAIDGASEWYRRGLDEPKTITEAIEDYKRDEDEVAQFFRECFEFDEDDPKARIERKQVARAYKIWCEENNAYVHGPRQIINRLRKLGVEETRIKNVYYWKGIKFRVN